ncbi:hypothetical protein RUM43_000199 [Polyplax serrata]|uniref:PPM-type phosphatase domain-containing protein n=1 Tax=Polyplax serrata TaxID=468196 RepID=A0AAN8SD14_POLSC
MFSKFRNAIINAVKGSDSLDYGDGQRGAGNYKYEYTRPKFLKFSEEEVNAASDTSIRPLILPRDVEFPFKAGYCECINAGKSKLNEDQGAVWRRKLTPKWWTKTAAALAESAGDGLDKSTGDDTPEVSDPSLIYTVFSIFDGHGGPMVAVIAAREFENILHERLEEIADILMPNTMMIGTDVQHHKGGLKYQVDFRKPVNPSQLIVGALETSFKEMDRRIGEDKENYDVKGGCTALVVLFILGKIYTACAGDSRAIVAVDSSVEPLSRDHTPTSERVRICNVGHQKSFLLKNDYTAFEYPKRPTSQDLGKPVLYRHPEGLGYSYRIMEPDDLKMPLVSGTGKRARLMGTIGVTRGFGDHELKALGSMVMLKPFLSAVPEIRILDVSRLTLSPTDIIIMGSDGLFDVTENAQAVTTVRTSFQKMVGGKGPSGSTPTDDMRYMCAAQDLVNYARGKPSPENRSWKKSNGSPASGDDITAWVIPLLPYAKEHEQWCLKSSVSVPGGLKAWCSTAPRLPIYFAEDCLLSDTED